MQRNLASLLTLLTLSGFLSGCCWTRSNSGLALKHSLGKDYADSTVTIPKILASCSRIEQLTTSDTPIAEVNFFVWAPHGNLGFGEHAALAFQFGSCPSRELFVIDIGRRPPDAHTTEISVLRVYDLKAFLDYTSESPHFEYSISWLCPNRTGKALIRNVLQDLEPFRKGNDPVAWNFNIIFHNCARYVQQRLGEVMQPPELKELVTNYRKDSLISPTEFGEHLQTCNYFAERLSNSGHDPCREDVEIVTRYFSKLSPTEKHSWTTFLLKYQALNSDAALFQNSLQ